MISYIKRKLTERNERKDLDNAVEGKMLDYRHNEWGHAIHFPKERKKDLTWRVDGFHTPLPSVHDTFLTKGKGGDDLVFIFIEVEPCGDPRDMYFAKVGCIRKATEADKDKAKPVGINFLL